MSYLAARYMTALRIKSQDGLNTNYTNGRMHGVCYLAHKQGYKGDNMSIQLQLLGEVLDAKR